MGFGGPVWHVSISGRRLPISPWTVATIELAGVGDVGLGEWRETGDVAVHLRRRLSLEEAALVGPVRDVRGTWEGQKRVARMDRYLPPEWRGREE